MRVSLKSTLVSTLVLATALAIALTALDLRPAAAASEGGPAAARQNAVDELSAARKKRGRYRGHAFPFAAVGAIIGGIASVAAAQRAREVYYDDGYYAARPAMVRRRSTPCRRTMPRSITRPRRATILRLMPMGRRAIATATDIVNTRRMPSGRRTLANRAWRRPVLPSPALPKCPILRPAWSAGRVSGAVFRAEIPTPNIGTNF
jgi:hypothetical protein